VTKQSAKAGEIISANSIVVSLLSVANFEIEANIPEADIAKVNRGNISVITLDAYGRDVEFQAKVVSIDPAETIIEGVATYKTIFQFIEEDERIKSGMTAKITISTDKREGVIAIPQRAIIRRNGSLLVKILEGENIKESTIETGLRGSDGHVEIISGVSEGDKIITFSEDL
jgi:RND family efflux transporter MFP subunit